MVRVHKPQVPGVGSGGPRVGTPGKTYANRTDLNNAGHQPVQVATGQPYGQAGAQAQAQKTLPLPTANAAGGAGLAPPSPASSAPPAPEPGPSHDPGAMGDFMRPSERPDEPLTHGAPFGAGAGPEAINQTPPNPLVQAVAVLNNLPKPDAQTQRLIAQLNANINNGQSS